MRSKRTVTRKRVSKRNAIRSTKKSAVPQEESGVKRQLLDLREQADIVLPEVTARVVCDYIAGMTDRYALLEHRRLFQVDPLV